METFCSKASVAKCGIQGALLLKKALNVYPDLHWQFVERWLKSHRRVQTSDFLQITAGDIPLQHAASLFTAAVCTVNSSIRAFVYGITFLE